MRRSRQRSLMVRMSPIRFLTRGFDGAGLTVFVGEDITVAMAPDVVMETFSAVGGDVEEDVEGPATAEDGL